MTATAETQHPPEVREHIRDLILVLADSKRLLGMRYAQWTLGSPQLEAGIACAAMAQDEWGHGRLLYAMLKEFDEDPDELEHGREPAAYRNIEVLDREPEGWPGLVALNALTDAALTVQCKALRDSSYEPLARRVDKLLDEEQFHRAHGAAWFRRLAGAGAEPRAALGSAAADALPVLLRWFGPDSERSELLREQGVADATGGELRDRYREAVAPLLGELDEGAALAERAPEFDGFDERSRRVSDRGPDAATVARLRGDKNRAFREV